MKVSDRFPVTLAGQTVAQAEVIEIDQGTVTLLIPGTKVVMETRTELAAPTPVEPESETIITGVDGPADNSAEPAATPDATVPPVQPTAPEPVPAPEPSPAPEPTPTPDPAPAPPVVEKPVVQDTSAVDADVVD